MSGSPSLIEASAEILTSSSDFVLDSEPDLSESPPPQAVNAAIMVIAARAASILFNFI